MRSWVKTHATALILPYARLGLFSLVHDHIVRDEPAALGMVKHLEIMRVPWAEGFAIFDLAGA
jgi:hypothetical protein